MARRRRKSELESWIEVLAKLPWQVCAALAPIAWFGFHLLSEVEPPPASGVKDLSGAVIASAASAVGMIGQYLVPAVLLIAAVVSWVSRRRRAKLLADQEHRVDSNALLGLSWRDFEALAAAHFERDGFAVSMTASGADGGVDVVAKKEGETYLVQCKQWRATQVGVAVVRELFGAMAAQGAAGAYVVSAGPFTRAAREFAEGRNIELLDARLLVANRGALPKREPIAHAGHAAPRCPRCQSAMVERTAKRGPNAGSKFLGCSRFPDCRGTASAE